MGFDCGPNSVCAAHFAIPFDHAFSATAPREPPSHDLSLLLNWAGPSPGTAQLRMRRGNGFSKHVKNNKQQPAAPLELARPVSGTGELRSCRGTFKLPGWLPGTVRRCSFRQKCSQHRNVQAKRPEASQRLGSEASAARNTTRTSNTSKTRVSRLKSAFGAKFSSRSVFNCIQNRNKVKTR